MRYELIFQDPSADSPRYLFEQIVNELRQPYVVGFEGIFAFASSQGVSSLLEDPDFDAFLARGGTCSLLVGLDAITDVRCLELLESLCAQHTNLTVNVFHNGVADLFHPKLSRFVHSDGANTVVVGSGNLTPGGLRRNIEAYSVGVFSPSELGASADLTAWDAFLQRHASRIKPIDDEAKEIAESNRIARVTSRRRVSGAVETESDVASEEAVAEDESAAAPGLEGNQRMLVAEVPRAGGRWNQVHFNREAVRDYFRAAPNSSDRVFLYEVRPDGSLGAVEARRVVYSATNVNHKIEFGAHHGDAYPSAGPPILVLREIGTRMHRYVMLFPGEAGYNEMTSLLGSTPSIGRGAQRIIVTASIVEAAWPGCPV